MGSSLPDAVYEKELLRLQGELVKMQDWVRTSGSRVAIVFEGRDAAGKGGVIARIREHLNPRWCKGVALAAPSEVERGQWYFQRYVSHLPSAGEIALFDRSWYNRAGVERVFGWCSDEEYDRFLRQCPAFEHMLIEDGIILRKYWLSISDDEQERRFQKRVQDPLKQWKLSPTDLEARRRWVDYSKAKDVMFAHTDTTESPWWEVDTDDKKRARINVIAHILSSIEWEPTSPPAIKLGKRPAPKGYERPPRSLYHYVPDHAASL